MNIGKAIKSVRNTKGLSLDALAEKSGVTKSMIWDIEKGRKSPTINTLNPICEALGIPLSCLVFLATPKGEIGIPKKLQKELSTLIIDLLKED